MKKTTLLNKEGYMAIVDDWDKKGKKQGVFIWLDSGDFNGVPWEKIRLKQCYEEQTPKKIKRQWSRKPAAPYMLKSKTHPLYIGIDRLLLPKLKEAVDAIYEELYPKVVQRLEEAHVAKEEKERTEEEKSVDEYFKKGGRI